MCLMMRVSQVSCIWSLVRKIKERKSYYRNGTKSKASQSISLISLLPCLDCEIFLSIINNAAADDILKCSDFYQFEFSAVYLIKVTRN